VQLAEIERLITRLEARTACTPAGPSSLAELEEALTRACLTALTNDARCRRLTEQLNDLEVLSRR
jgi:uncharacterized coiled-coil protein SlyX